MFTYFFTYEIRYWLRGAMLWVFLAIIALMIAKHVLVAILMIGLDRERAYHRT